MKQAILLIGILLILTVLVGCANSSFEDCFDTCRTIKGREANCVDNCSSLGKCSQCYDQFKPICFEECKNTD